MAKLDTNNSWIRYPFMSPRPRTPNFAKSQMEAKFAGFREMWCSFCKIRKNPIPSLKFGKFDFKNTLLERPFFEKKIIFDFYFFLPREFFLYKMNPDKISRKILL